jgi:hypothetical protein
VVFQRPDEGDFVDDDAQFFGPFLTSKARIAPSFPL